MRLMVYGDIGGSGGYVAYCRGLFCGGSWPARFDTTVACSRELAAELGTLDEGIEVEAHPWPSSRHRALRYLWHLWAYPRLIGRIKPNVEFYPSGNLRNHLRRPRAVTVCHNLLPFEAAELARYAGSTRARWIAHGLRQGRAFERSSGVIFLSEYSQTLVEAQFPRIKSSRVISHGVDDEFRLGTERSYALGGRITILYVSPVYHYKHQGAVVRAVGALRRQTGLDVRLRLVGGGAREDLETLHYALEECKAAAFCELVPFIARAALIDEYRKADLFVFASSCESFGISLLEAMASRLPIACSSRSGLQDILGPAGEYFDPENLDSIVISLGRLVASPDRRRACGEDAYARSMRYSWRRCASETAAYLEEMGEA